MESNGTAILLNQKAPNGGDLALVVDFQLKLLSLVEITKNGSLNIRAIIKDYTKRSSVKLGRLKK